ncbi:S8 family peptidase [Luedemannella helvata]|uniref:Peptidase S8/S53 domain-containing protein n=1 Tax=Luedemannella helvata TaxID=349315 RepID=A0ABN2JQJ9_9ACTN
MKRTGRGLARFVVAGALVLPLLMGPGPLAVATPGGAVGTPDGVRVDGEPADNDGFVPPNPPVNAAVAGTYTVIFDDGLVSQAQVRAVARRMEAAHNVDAQRYYLNAMRGFEFQGTAQEAADLSADYRVSRVQPDYRVYALGWQTGPVQKVQQGNPPSWGLDRIDQSSLPLDHKYTYPNRGAGVTVYVIDSGIRASHREFGGRAVAAMDFTGEGDNEDCAGHGTHVAGTIGGSRVGVAKGVRLVALRVLDCNGVGLTSGVVAALDWVLRNGQRPAVVNMSLGHAGSDAVLNKAVANVSRAGIPVVVAAGNNKGDACSVSPASSLDAMTVGAIDRTDHRDVKYSNYGPCLNGFAPGTRIYSAWPDADDTYATMSGTSMAAPHVTGAVAIAMAANPTLTTTEFRACLRRKATRGKLADTRNSPNVLVRIIGAC